MSDLRHFIIFNRTDNRCVTWLLRASSLCDAIQKYVINQHTDLREDGKFAVQDGYDDEIVHGHPQYENAGKILSSNRQKENNFDLK